MKSALDATGIGLHGIGLHGIGLHGIGLHGIGLARIVPECDPGSSVPAMAVRPSSGRDT